MGHLKNIIPGQLLVNTFYKHGLDSVTLKANFMSHLNCVSFSFLNSNPFCAKISGRDRQSNGTVSGPPIDKVAVIWSILIGQ
jgi:hypothetical protein